MRAENKQLSAVLASTVSELAKKESVAVTTAASVPTPVVVPTPLVTTPNKAPVVIAASATPTMPVNATVASPAPLVGKAATSSSGFGDFGAEDAFGAAPVNNDFDAGKLSWHAMEYLIILYNL